MESEIDIQTKISTAMCSRLPDFKAKADSLTLEGVRRLLEKDLGLEEFALDLHKKFIKQRLEEYFTEADDENDSKSSPEKVEDIHLKKENAAKEHERPQLEKETEEPSFEDKEDVEGTPTSDGRDTTKQDSEETPVLAKHESILNEDIIKKAIKKRTPYFSAHSETITFSGARRLLEEDLKLHKNALDAYKKFIHEKLDEIFRGPSVDESANGSKAKSATKNSSNKLKDRKRKKPEKVESEDGSLDSLASNKDADEESGKRKRQTAKKGKAMNSEGFKKRKKLVKESKSSSDEEEASTKANETEECENSEGGQSQSSAEEGVKKRREASTQVYGKRVEHLKSIIKASGMSVPPAVYKRVKQAPESKREGHLIKELEEILGKEGLSANSSEKEIKAVKKKKERAKDLEGIDLGNIVSNSRSRRATFDFMIPPKPSEPVKNDDSDNEDNDENTDDDDAEDSDSEEASEGFNEDDGDDESD